MTDLGGTTLSMPPLSPLALAARRASASVVGRSVELGAIRQELAVAKAGQLTVLTLEGEPGIGKTRLLVAASDLAAAESFLCVAVSADEELRGPFMLARGLLGCLATEDADGADDVRRALDAVSGRDEPGLEALAPDRKLYRALDLAALALRRVGGARRIAIMIDDLQWADEDSLRLLRYLVRTDFDVPMFLAFTLRPHETAFVTEAATLIADMERMGVVRRLPLARFTPMEAAELLKQVLGAPVTPQTAAALHAQAEGVPFILEELARTYRSAGMIQQIDSVWTLARNADRLVPSAVRTLIERRAVRLPEPSKAALADAAILGRSFGLKDLAAIRMELGDIADDATPTMLADALAPAVAAGLIVELRESAVADYSFTHDQVRGLAAASLNSARRRAIHAAIVDMLSSDGEVPDQMLGLLADHARAAGDPQRSAGFSIRAAEAALAAHAPDVVLRIVDAALPGASAPRDRVALLLARDDAFDMLRRSTDRLEGLSEMAALAEALGDAHLQLQIMLRRAAALRLSDEEDAAARLGREVLRIAEEQGDRRSALAAWMELGQDLLGRPLGESFGPPETEVNLDGAGDAYQHAMQLAEELGDKAALAAATRELGVVRIARARGLFVKLVQAGEHLPYAARIAAGEPPPVVFAGHPIGDLVTESSNLFERSLELFDEVGDRRGVMSAVISIAYITLALDIHFRAAARALEAIRRLTGGMRSLTWESERAAAELQMLFGVHVFARAKVVPDLAIARGEEAYQQARVAGDRMLEFASAGGVALVHLDLGDLAEAERWLDRASVAASAAPTPYRARQLELWRGIARAASGDPEGMRRSLERAVNLAGEQGRPAARWEAMARLALEAARLGAERADPALLVLAERSARSVKELVPLLPGKPLWGAQADAALAEAARGRGRADEAAEAGRAALVALQEAMREDLHLEILIPAARAVLAGGTSPEQEAMRGMIRDTLTAIAQRILDEDLRVRWFRGPLGTVLVGLAGDTDAVAGLEALKQPESLEPATHLAESESRLLWLVIEGRTDADIARELGVTEEEVVKRIAAIYARIGATSRADAAALAFRGRLVQ